MSYRRAIADSNNRCWGHDIEMFGRYAALFGSATSAAARAHCVANMRRIKDKYPTAMKHEVIPTV